MNLVPFRLHKGMFVAQVAQVARKSIEPAIRGGAWRLFRVPVQGTRPGGEFGLGSRHTASRATVSVRLRQATHDSVVERGLEKAAATPAALE